MLNFEYLLSTDVALVDLAVDGGGTISFSGIVKNSESFSTMNVEPYGDLVCNNEYVLNYHNMLYILSCGARGANYTIILIVTS